MVGNGSTLPKRRYLAAASASDCAKLGSAISRWLVQTLAHAPGPEQVAWPRRQLDRGCDRCCLQLDLQIQQLPVSNGRLHMPNGRRSPNDSSQQSSERSPLLRL